MSASRTAQPAQAPEALLTPAEVAALFRVDPKTVTRWAKAGKLSSIRTLGGTVATARTRCASCSAASKPAAKALRPA